MEWHTFPGREKARQALLSLANDKAVQHLLLRSTEEKDRDEELKKNTLVLEEMSRQHHGDAGQPTARCATSKSAGSLGRVRSAAAARAPLKGVWGGGGTKYTAPLAPQPYFERRPPKRPPTLEQMELDMKAWAKVVDEREAAVHEGRMLEYERARKAFERNAREAFEAGQRGKAEMATELQDLKDQQETKLHDVEKRCLSALQEMQGTAQRAEAERDANIAAREAQASELTSLYDKITALEETLSSQAKAKAEVQAMYKQAKRKGEAQQVEARDAQIEQVRMQFVRRARYRDVAMGRAAWVELAGARGAAMARLGKAATRLRNGVKARAFAQWLIAWEACVRQARTAKLAAEQERSRASEVAELEKNRTAEAEEKRAEAEAQAAVMSQLREELAEREKQLEERAEAHAAEVAALTKEMEEEREAAKTNVDQLLASREQVCGVVRSRCWEDATCSALYALPSISPVPSCMPCCPDPHAPCVPAQLLIRTPAL